MQTNLKVVIDYIRTTLEILLNMRLEKSHIARIIKRADGKNAKAYIDIYIDIGQKLMKKGGQLEEGSEEDAYFNNIMGNAQVNS